LLLIKVSPTPVLDVTSFPAPSLLLLAHPLLVKSHSLLSSCKPFELMIDTQFDDTAIKFRELYKLGIETGTKLGSKDRLTVRITFFLKTNKIKHNNRPHMTRH